MRKEVIVAIVVGIIFGGIFTYGIRRANLALKPAATDITNEKQGLPENVEEAESDLPDSLTILAPEQNDVFSQDSTTITGITKPGCIVVISTEDEDFVIRSDASGEFSQKIELDPGLNKIIIDSFFENESVGEESIYLVYTTEIDL
ncbi:hypothetical protein JXA63_00165 [Candidatus Woesebacteria bacterium]|nr:hypothetical protein [Candidatus Woesebacteria bacterium]